jgi:hypothetical protein
MRFGMATPAMIPMMPMITISSVRLNPAFFRSMSFTCLAVFK